MPEPRGREWNHVAGVLLVSEEQSALPEGGTAQSEREYLTELLDHEYFDLLPNLPGQILQIRLVLLRQDDPGDSGPHCAQNLLLHSADREHPAAQRDLAGHRDVVAN